MKNKRESGAVAVEASIIVTLVMISITIMFYIGMVLYQQTAISTIANRTATNIAQVYSNTLRDPFTGYVDPENAYQPVTHSSIKTDAYLDAVKDKGTAYAQYRLKKSQIIPTQDREVDVQVVSKPNELFKSQVVVTITDSYSVPLLSFFGVDAKATFTGTGRADCVDYLEYLPGVDAVSDPEEYRIPDPQTMIVTFIKDKYTGGFHDAVPVLMNKSIISSNHQTHSTMPANPELNGMQFTGWVTEDGRVFSAATEVQGNMTVYGTWNCTVTLDPTGGTVNPTKLTVVYHKPTTLPTPERYGYAFEGWFTKKDGKDEQYISGVTQIPGNITLYAHWRCTHAAYDMTMLDAGNCQTQSTWQYDCKTCDYSYKAKGAYGACAKGNKTIGTKPSCTFAGEYLIKCKFCAKTLATEQIAKDPNGHMFAANGVDFDQSFRREPTCSRVGIQGSRCSRCGAEKGKELAKLAHTWSGRCGVEHIITNNPLNINRDPFDQSKAKYDPVLGRYNAPHSTSAGYKHSTKVECYLCSVCGEPYGGWTNRVDINGIKIAWGVICRQHKDSAGIRADKAYGTTATDTGRKVIRVHD